MPFEPTYDSLKEHRVPQWFHDAKLGIFVHWGLYSVPGWAPHEADIDKLVAAKGWEAWFTHNAYAEWYLNTLRISDSPTRRHHVATYGEHFSYDDFAPMFDQAVENWNPDDWAALFQKIGARYVVLTTKHHDGFLLWPSKLTSPHKPGRYATRRDLVGDLTDAVRGHDMRMGLYYSGGLDWSFNETPVRDHTDVHGTIVQSAEFVEYADAHWRELIDRYQPALLWNDIGYPAAANPLGLFAYYYDRVPEGVINDRWRQRAPERVPGAGDMVNPPAADHCDFTTPEYARYDEIVEKKWEATRGIGHSFGYNQNEGPEDYLSVQELVHSFVDIVSKNGNLLLDVGPMADGTIPNLQRERLSGLGDWLDVNGAAIFQTRPWRVFREEEPSGPEIRFTQKDSTLYAICLGWPESDLRLKALGGGTASGRVASVHLLGSQESLAWSQDESGLRIAAPTARPCDHAYTFQIELGR